jgi:pimeloyl-ACP methyl ester carboxylesterase
MRAIEPASSGLLHLHGFQVAYEAFGEAGRPALLLLPPWQIVHSRIWKMQIAFLARSFHVVTFDAPGNGRSQRTTDPAAYEYERVARQGLGVLDQLGIERASLLGFSRSCAYCIWLAATVPERIERVVLIGNGVTPAGWGSPPDAGFHERRETYEDWEKENAVYWREHYDDWLEYFFSQVFIEPHSTKGIDESVSWGRETDVENLVASVSRPELWPESPAHEAIAAIQCPVLLVHGGLDNRSPIEASLALASARPDWELVVLEGSGHAPIVRDPVRVNLLIHEFLQSVVWHEQRSHART